MRAVGRVGPRRIELDPKGWERTMRVVGCSLRSQQIGLQSHELGEDDAGGR